MKPGETVPFSPADQLDRPEAERAVYHLRVPTVYDRVAYRRALGEKQARLHGPVDLLRCLRRGVEAVMAESMQEDRDFLLQAIDEQIARAEAYNAAGGAKAFDLDEEDGRAAFQQVLMEMTEGGEALRQVEGLVARGFPPYASMLGDNAVYWSLAGIEAARVFVDRCNGIEGFSRTRLGVSDAFLSRIPEGHLVAIGLKVSELMRPSEADAKNSVSPSGSRSGTATSKAARTRRRKTRSRTIVGT